MLLMLGCSHYISWICYIKLYILHFSIFICTYMIVCLSILSLFYFITGIWFDWNVVVCNLFIWNNIWIWKKLAWKIRILSYIFESVLFSFVSGWLKCCYGHFKNASNRRDGPLVTDPSMVSGDVQILFLH